MRFNEFKNTAITEPTALTIGVPTGHKGVEVADGQKVLLLLGYKLPKHGVDGIDGPETSAAISAFQKDNGIAPSGDLDSATVAKLNQLISEKNLQFKKSTSADVKHGAGTQVDLSTIQDPNFNAKLEKIAKELGISSGDLMAIIKTESGGRPTARNRIAGGLIGFTERTARGLGTTLDDILKMDAVEQLDYVYKFYRMVGVQPGMDRGDIYMLTFLPAYVNASDSTVLGQKGAGELGNTGLSKHAIWDQNPLFGKSRGKEYFTVGDVKNTINRVA